MKTAFSLSAPCLGAATLLKTIRLITLMTPLTLITAPWTPAATAAPAPAATASASTSAPISVATYNLRYNNPADGPNAWPARRDMVTALIRYHGFDIVGTQEALADQVADLARMEEFDHVGVGRDDGKNAGEHSAIFFRKSRFALLDKGDFWLSETPERPSRGWDATCCNRLVSWARLRERASGRTLFVFSAHFDHEGEVARRASSALLLRKVAAIASTEPAIVVGDFNSTPDTPQMQAMASTMRDAYRVSLAPPYGPTGTYNGFRLDAPLTDRIDYIFVDAHAEVLDYAVLTDARDRRYPSDHHPVVARVRLR